MRGVVNIKPAPTHVRRQPNGISTKLRKLQRILIRCGRCFRHAHCTSSFGRFLLVIPRILTVCTKLHCFQWTSPSIDPSHPNVQLQPTSALSSDIRMETLFPQSPHEAPHPITQTSCFASQNISYPQTIVPQATAASLIGNVRIRCVARQFHHVENPPDSRNAFLRRRSCPNLNRASLRPAGELNRYAPSACSSLHIHQLPGSPPPTRYLVKVPQKIYNVGRGQWNFKHSEPISFSVNGVAGINMLDALGKHFTGLDGRDDLMFLNENVGTATSCRFQVWSLSFTTSAPYRHSRCVEFPGYPKNGSTQVRKFASSVSSRVDWGGRFPPWTGKRSAYR